MFDIGFTEMLVVAIIALLVLGPERLPGAVRTVGLTIGRIKRGFADVRAQVEREIGADELRQQLHNERVMAELAKQDKQDKHNADAEAEAAPTPRPASNVKRAGNQTDTSSSQTTAVPAAEVSTEAAPTSPPSVDESDKPHER